MPAKRSEDDPLAEEISVSVELEASGLKGKAKSRAVASIDRLIGNWVDRYSVGVEGRNARIRSIDRAEREVIAAAKDFAIERMKADPELAERLVLDMLAKEATSRQNKIGVVIEMEKELKRLPPPSADSGPEEIKPEVMDRIETYAAGASTDELRERWGRVLAGEIRQPGTFSLKVLRVVDEISAETAALFEKFCEDRIADAVPMCLRDIDFAQVMELTEAGLLQSSQAFARNFRTIENKLERWIGFENYGIVFVHEGALPRDIQNGAPLGTSGLPCYALTRSALAIASLLDDPEERNIKRLAKKFREWMPQAEIKILKGNGHAYIPYAELPKGPEKSSPAKRDDVSNGPTIATENSP